MRIRHARAARTAARFLLLPAAVTGVLAISSPQAAAHTGLNGSDPANDAVLDAVPRTVTLTFSDPMTQKYAQLAVTGPDGAVLGDGAPAVAGREVTLRLKEAKAPGRYTVGYRVVSADGHPVTGTSAFTVRPLTATASGTTSPAPATPTRSASAPASTSPSTSPSPTSSLSRSAIASGERASTSLKAIGIGFGLGLVGMVAAMVVTVRRRRRSTDDAG